LFQIGLYAQKVTRSLKQLVMIRSPADKKPLREKHKTLKEHMKKNADLIDETIRTVRHPFQRAETRPHKSQKHRYERRKVREYIRLADWNEEAEDDPVFSRLDSLGMRLA